MPETPKHSVSVAGVVVRDDGAVLSVQRRDNGRWEPPGGVLELDETFEQGVRREVLEETGVSVTVSRLTGVYKNMPRGVVALVFRCAYSGGQINETDESEKVRWLSLAEVRERMEPAYAIRVLDALRPWPEAATRVHDGTEVIRT